jgi:hypothetical protein
MRRLVGIAALAALTLCPASWAQRGGMRGGSFGGHGGFVSHGAGFRGPGPAHFGHSGTSFHGSFHSGFRHRGDGWHAHIRTYPYYWGWGYPYSYGGYYSPFWWNWWDDSSSSAPWDDYAAQQSTRQVDELSQQVQDLREQQREQEYRQSASAAPAPPPPSAPRASTPTEAKSNNDMTTVLVFLDRHIQEVKNYAIANEKVLVFDDHRTKKIPLADIDLAATMKLNDERGVDFEVPNPTAAE